MIYHQAAAELTCSSKSKDYDIVDAQVAEDAWTFGHCDQVSGHQLAGDKLAEAPSEAILDDEVGILGGIGRIGGIGRDV